ncbi:Lipid-A-disaccharide synthase [bacterium HR21]|nr:Lipid-A-disaccharide synthase [bacterium HR21]
MRVLISAGDPSGDRHAARLMAEWRRLQPELEFVGIGGPRMQQQGLHSLVPFEELAVVGFWEVAQRYGFFRRLLRRCQALLPEVAAVVLVDYPGFNLQLAKAARRHGVPVYYYIAPQVWAWGRWRLRTLAETVSLLLVVLPFEEEFFQRHGIRTVFVGHPLLDEPILCGEPPPLSAREPQVIFLPGSRRQEWQRHLPVLRQTEELLRRDFPELRIATTAPPGIDPPPQWHHNANVYEALRSSRAALVKLGTSTLEAALCGTPFVAFYRTSALSYGLARLLVRLPAATLVNILAPAAPVVPEFLQWQARPQKLARALARLLCSETAAEAQRTAFAELRQRLGQPGVARRAASVLAEALHAATSSGTRQSAPATTP